eukprot:11164194-Karenia_brevis.AAC.1
MSSTSTHEGLQFTSPEQVAKESLLSLRSLHAGFQFSSPPESEDDMSTEECSEDAAMNIDEGLSRID